VRRLLAVVAGTLALAGMTRAASGYPPRINYQLQCMGCHRADGSGEEGRVPSLRRSLLLLSGSRQGRRYVLRVPGVAQAPLSDQDTAALLNWMSRNLSDRPVPDDFVGYSAAEVARFRHRPLVATMATRARLLEAAER
jgi:hypothetical protein